jgi:hypothetical protein
MPLMSELHLSTVRTLPKTALLTGYMGRSAISGAGRAFPMTRLDSPGQSFPRFADSVSVGRVSF